MATAWSVVLGAEPGQDAGVFRLADRIGGASNASLDLRNGQDTQQAVGARGCEEPGDYGGAGLGRVVSSATTLVSSR